MDIELIELFPNSIRFILTNSSLSFANAIRRILLADVPSLVIEDVYVLKNNSPLFDEFIAHRLGLIPLKYDESLLKLNFRDNCECQGIGCNLCTVTLTLAKETDNQNTIMVYSGDLVSSHPGIEPVSDKIPIVKLGQEQALELECMAQLGTGKEHAKWQPVSALGYQNFPIPSIDIKKCDNCENCIDACYRGVFQKISGEVKPSDPLNCNLCNYCLQSCEKGAISITSEPKKIIISFEINGGFSPATTLIQASEILLAKTDEFKNSLERMIIEKEEKEKKRD